MAGVLAEPTFLGVRADEWSALGVWFTGLVTLGLLLYAARQLHQASQMRDEQSRPYVVVDFHGRSIMISLGSLLTSGRRRRPTCGSSSTNV